MRDKRLWFGILVLLLLFGMAVSEFKTQPDTRLNGTWRNVESGYYEKYNSGNYEFSRVDGTPRSQGTYTTSNGKITYTPKYFFVKENDHEQIWISKYEVEADIFKIYTREYFINNKILTFKFFINDKVYLRLVSRNRKFIMAKSIGEKNIYSGEVIYDLSKIGHDLIIQQNFERIIKDNIIEKMDSIENVLIQIVLQEMEIYSSEIKPINVNVIIKFKPKTDFLIRNYTAYRIQKILLNKFDGLHKENIFYVDQDRNIINNVEVQTSDSDFMEMSKLYDEYKKKSDNKK